MKNTEYNTKIKPNLALISEYKAHNLANKDIAKHLDVNYSDFQDYVRTHPELREALRVGEDMIVDQAESALYKQAFIKGNVTAIMFILKKLNPEKWGEVVQEHQEKLPEIKIELKDAKIDRKDLDALVQDIAHLGKDKPN
jgi:hypothetical protein